MVEWKKLSEVCNIERGVRVIRKDLQEAGDIPVYQNSLKPLGYYRKCNMPANTTFVISAGAAGEIGFCDIPFWAADDCLCISSKENNVNKFFYYYLLTKQILLKSRVRKASVPRLSRTEVENLLTPIPSLSEQNRIVSQLDTFTSSIENLKEQIAQRRKQYEYYRDQLLDLEGKEGVEMKTLGDIMQIVRGASPRPIQNYITTADDGVNWIKIGDVSPNDKYISSAKEKITIEGAKKSRYLHPGDFILSNSMSFGRPYILKVDGCIHDGWIAMSDYEDFVTSGYLYEILNAESTQKYWRKKANNGGAMTNLNSDIVRDTPIPIPSLLNQQLIVDILEKFEASLQNLEAQLSLREMQYEYYRNQLLSFN